MAAARHKTAKNRRDCAAGNRMLLFYQEGFVALGAPCCLMPNLATALPASRPGSSPYEGFPSGDKRRAADWGRPEIVEIFVAGSPSAGRPGSRRYGAGVVGLTRARQITMPVTAAIAGMAIQRKRLCAVGCGVCGSGVGPGSAVSTSIR